MMKKIFFVAVTVLLTTLSFAQDVKKKIEAQAKDPKAKENAAKADVYILKNKMITDTSTVYKSPASSPVAKKNNTTTSTKKKKVKKKSY